MSYAIARPRCAPKLNRFAWLMGLYAENYAYLSRVFRPEDLREGVYASSVGDGLDLRLDVLARHAYTVELRLSYALIDPVTGEPHTAHTTNPVPLLIAGEAARGRSLRGSGRLCDIATTLMPILGLRRTAGMDGVDLFA